MKKLNSTLAYYEKHATAYAARDFLGTFGEYRELFIARVKEEFSKKRTPENLKSENPIPPEHQVPPKNQVLAKPKILELGSGSGRDAQVFLTHGFDVTLVDGSAELAKIAKERTGQNVLVMDFADLDFEAEFSGEFEGIWAAASLLHVPSDQLPGVLQSVERGLQRNGVFVASFKESDHDWVDDLGRYFCAMTESHLDELVINSGLELVSIEKGEGQGSDGKPTVWLWVVARKN
ncbi:class I SAM-dependent methyltransferase [Kiloniella majae]|uniref:class I SAM-dependent methyltransferase n=2 Tax=Kiloniella majae TaxID=1938558 RepID=UPI000A2770EA|nr:class I SAM-dependent methyltransferase [Kiloniella majae]